MWQADSMQTTTSTELSGRRISSEQSEKRNSTRRAMPSLAASSRAISICLSLIFSPMTRQPSVLAR